MGGRGAGVIIRGRRTFVRMTLGGGGGGQPAMQGGGAPPNVQPGQPVPAVTLQQLQSMSGTEFANYLDGLKSTPIDQNTYYNHYWDTQRLIANIPELNRAPEVVDPQTFKTIKGKTLFRTVNQAGTQTAVDICGRTMTSDVTTIGEGVLGDGFYFAADRGTSQRIYGLAKNNINKTATMAVKLNSNAKVIDHITLNGMLNNESSTVRRAVENMTSGGSWSQSGLMAYALYKGYNVVESAAGNGVYNIIDRNAATFSGEIRPWR